MKHTLAAILCLLCLPACETVRTVYDDSGNEIQEHSGGERSLEDYLAGSFDKEVSRKKNEDGVPESVSNKVSSYQKHLDNARKDTTTYSTGSYDGLKTLDRNKSYEGANKAFDRGTPFSGTFANSTYSKDLRPDFMSDSKGIYGREDTYGDASFADRADGDGRAYDAFGIENIYGTNPSDISRDATSGYYESRKNKTPQPRIIDRQDYYKKSIFETRALLGRDNEPTEE